MMWKLGLLCLVAVLAGAYAQGLLSLASIVLKYHLCLW